MFDELNSISVVPAIQTTVNLETLLAWGEPKSVPTENGERLICKAKPTEEFWQLWNSKRAELRAAGITITKWPKSSENWEVAWWKPVPQEELKRRAEAIKASVATDADIEIPCPDGFEYLGYQRAGVVFMLNRFGIKPAK